jgi:8-oxo-dGTP pyrophosphatase MutT (NUDIX family)
MTEFQLLCQHLTARALPLTEVQIEFDRVRQAAVTILLREEQGTAEILIIKRAERPGDHWSGHLALPGGRAEAGDANLIYTAVRETWEEVGIQLLTKTHFLGRLKTITPRHPRLPEIEIVPLIAVAPPEIVLTPNAEVAAAFWLPIQYLCAAGLCDVYPLVRENAIIKYPAYPSPHGPIWGITERILTDFLRLLS